MQYHREGEDDEDRRLLSIGKTGSGKSATGNIIFNRTVFESEISSSSVTRVCQKHTGAVNNRRVTVIDTPDFKYSTHTDFDSDSELKRALQLCSKGAHVILLFLSLSTFTEQEMDFISWFEQKFDQEALRFTLVLFTHADKRHMRSLGELIRRNNKLSGFINRCGQRYHEFNIKAVNRQQVTVLMEKIDRLVFENKNSCYTLEMMQETERRRQEEERREDEEEKAEEERRREEEMTREGEMRTVENRRREEEMKEKDHQIALAKVRRETEICVRREYEKKERRDDEEKRAEEERKEKEHQMTLDRVKIETELRVRREYEVGKREKVLFFKQIKKYVCISIFFALATGVVSIWKEDKNGWTFMRGLIVGGSTSTAGVFTGFLWRLMLKSQFICSSSHERPSTVIQVLLKTVGVMCGLSAGAVIGHFLGGNVHPVTMLAGSAGAAGALTALQLRC